LPAVRFTYKYKMYNSKANKHLDRAIHIACEIWNHCIRLHRRYYKLYGKHLSDNKLKKHLTKLKKRSQYEHWNELGSQAIQDIAERIGRSYKAFFDHVKEKRSGRKSPPRFRKEEDYHSITLKQAGYKFLDETNKVVIMGHTYKYVKHRPMMGTIKTVTIKKNRLGEYFIAVSVVLDLPDVPLRAGDAVGLDFGVKCFLTTDTGELIQSPLWYRQSLNDLRRAHRQLSRCQKNSGNRKRALLDLFHVYEDVSNSRRDWLYKLAHDLTDRYAVICVEDLDIDAWKHLWGQKVSDLGIAEFLTILEQVARKKSSRVVKVSRWYPSSKTCRNCGHVNRDLKLSDRVWVCPNCGTVIDRDVNAAINIREEGLRLSCA